MFQQIYQDFYEDLLKIIPSVFPKKHKLEKDLLPFFLKEWYPHMEHVSLAKASSLPKSVTLFPKITLTIVMNKLNENNKEIVWRYLHTLFCHSIPELKKRREELEKKKEFTQWKKISKNPVLISNMVLWKRNLHQKELAEMKKKQTANPILDEKFLENSAIGKLAKELFDEFDPEEFKNMEEMNDPGKVIGQLMSSVLGGGESKINPALKKMMTKFSEKMNSDDLDKEKLFGEAAALAQKMGGLGGGMGGLGGLMNMAQAMNGMFGDGRAEKKKKELRKKLSKKKKKK